MSPLWTCYGMYVSFVGSKPSTPPATTSSDQVSGLVHSARNVLRLVCLLFGLVTACMFLCRVKTKHPPPPPPPQPPCPVTRSAAWCTLPVTCYGLYVSFVDLLRHVCLLCRVKTKHPPPPPPQPPRPVTRSAAWCTLPVTCYGL